ncbi:MAG: Uma2 family endonuclease [Dehalococcoidia bacterium]|nr:Uma2 family endonuclease [Dehalococcoidia bacterium]
MTTRHVPKTGRSEPLTRLPDPPKPPDAMQQLPHVSNAYVILNDYFRHRTDVFVGGDGYLCYDASDLRRAPKPDCLVAFEVNVPPVSITEANGYTISEVGKPPDFVLEVASESTGRRDYTVKREMYASYLVREQWRFDHTGGRYHDAPLAGDRLVDGRRYVPISIVSEPGGLLRGTSEVLGLELHWDRGMLRFWDPASEEYLPDLTEAKAQRDAEAAARRSAVAQRDAAEERVRQLESELRRLQPGN